MSPQEIAARNNPIFQPFLQWCRQNKIDPDQPFDKLQSHWNCYSSGWEALPHQPLHVQRYSPTLFGGMKEDSEGDHVTYDDYMALSYMRVPATERAKGVIRDAYTNLIAALNEHDEHQPGNHDWMEHRKNIVDMETTFPDFINSVVRGK